MNARRQLGDPGRWGRGTACLACAILLCVGCGRDAPPATVEGTVRLGNKPLDNCLVTFLPEARPGDERPHSTGLTDARGRYRLRFDDGREGASVGRHRVTVEDLSVSTGAIRRDHGTADRESDATATPPPVRPSRVSAGYASPSLTPLRKDIEPGDQVIDLEVE
jgi:hypothetical protein